MTRAAVFLVLVAGCRPRTSDAERRAREQAVAWLQGTSKDGLLDRDEVDRLSRLLLHVQTARPELADTWLALSYGRTIHVFPARWPDPAVERAMAPLNRRFHARPLRPFLMLQQWTVDSHRDDLDLDGVAAAYRALPGVRSACPSILASNGRLDYPHGDVVADGPRTRLTLWGLHPLNPFDEVAESFHLVVEPDGAVVPVFGEVEPGEPALRPTWSLPRPADAVDGVPYRYAGRHQRPNVAAYAGVDAVLAHARHPADWVRRHAVATARHLRQPVFLDELPESFHEEARRRALELEALFKVARGESKPD
jgi:hypothetical protein